VLEIFIYFEGEISLFKIKSFINCASISTRPSTRESKRKDCHVDKKMKEQRSLMT